MEKLVNQYHNALEKKNNAYRRMQENPSKDTLQEFNACKEHFYEVSSMVLEALMLDNKNILDRLKNS